MVFGITLGYVFTQSHKLNEPSIMQMRKKERLSERQGCKCCGALGVWREKEMSAFSHISLSNEPQLTGESNLHTEYNK